VWDGKASRCDFTLMAPTRQSFRPMLCLWVCAVFVAATGSPAGEVVTYRDGGPFCGLFCLYVAAGAEGREFDLEKLLDAKYISSSRGSSAADLRRAAEDRGLYVRVLERLTTRDLIGAPYPMILFTKGDQASERYDHYILVLDCDETHCRIYEPPRTTREVPRQELLPGWSGTAIMVSASSISRSKVLRGSVYRTVVVGLGVVLVVGCMRLLGRRYSRHLMGGSFWQGLSIVGIQIALIMCVATGVTLVDHCFGMSGFLAQEQAVAEIQESFRGSFFPRIGAARVSELMSTEAIFIDARFRDDFAAGHLDGAINVPVDATTSEQKAALAGVDRNSQLVIYCQSKSCRYAEIVASRLFKGGFENLSIFDGGWDRWVGEGRIGSGHQDGGAGQ